MKEWSLAWFGATTFAMATSSSERDVETSEISLNCDNFLAMLSLF
jgi:hypothetical protein